MFLIESIVGLASVILMGAIRSEDTFKETVVLYFLVMTVLSYLFFLKDQSQIDIFDILFPQMTIFQINMVLMDNFFTNIAFLERYLNSVFAALREPGTEGSTSKIEAFESRMREGIAQQRNPATSTTSCRPT